MYNYITVHEEMATSYGLVQSGLLSDNIKAQPLHVHKHYMVLISINLQEKPL